MKGIRCNECGLLNWSTAESCKRCHAGLASSPSEVEASPRPHDETIATAVANESQTFSFGTPPPPVHSRRKVILVLAALFLLLVSVSVPVSIWALKSSAPDYVKLIPNSSQYRKTLNILINRECDSHTSLAEQMSGLNISHKPTLLPETLMLYHAGFLRFHQISDPADESTDIFFLMNPYTIEPKSNDVARQWRELTRRMKIGNSPVNESNQWWIVPIGEREFGQVTKVEKNYEFASSTDFLNVDFTWRWKPNEFGRALDISQPSYKRPEDIVGKGNWLPADSLGMPVRDSRATYKGYARLRKQDDGTWQVTTIWFADSPDQHYPADQNNQDSLRHTWNTDGF